MKSASSRIWTGVAVSISYDYNHYTTGTSSHLRQVYHVTEAVQAVVDTHYWYYLPTPPLGQDMTQGQFLSGV